MTNVNPLSADHIAAEVNAEAASARQKTHRTAATADIAKIQLEKLYADRKTLKAQLERLNIELIDCEHNIAIWQELGEQCL